MDALFCGVLFSSSPLAAQTGFVCDREVYVKSIGASEERILEFMACKSRMEGEEVKLGVLGAPRTLKPHIEDSGHHPEVRGRYSRTDLGERGE